MQAESIKIAGQSRMAQTDAGDYFYRLLEGEGAVPFQFVFGSLPWEGYYFFTGEGITRLLGIETGSVTEKSFRERIIEYVPLSENLPSDPEDLYYIISNGLTAEYRIEMLMLTASGEKKWVRESGISVREAATGKITGVIGMLTDVTEKKQMLTYLKEAVGKAEESERIKDAFLQNIAHEVRTPLNAIVGFSNLLSEPRQEYKLQKEFADIITDSTGHFLEVIDNILEISRIEAGEIRVVSDNVSPAEMVRKIHQGLLKRASEKHLEFKCSIPQEHEGFRLVTDSYKLQQILTNLTGNAIKFTLNGLVELGFTFNEGVVEFFVNDTGIGIRSEHQSRIFNKFYQAESGITRRFSGTGLGLPISRAYADMLGGWITFSSKPGAGSSFSFMLPVQD